MFFDWIHLTIEFKRTTGMAHLRSTEQVGLSSNAFHLYSGGTWFEFQPVPQLSCLRLFIQCVPLATEPGISLIILTPMKILQQNLNSSMCVVWEMKRNVSVVRLIVATRSSGPPASLFPAWHASLLISLSFGWGCLHNTVVVREC